MPVAFFGDHSLKEAVMKQLRKHREMDQIVQGTYWCHYKDGIERGCHLGCLTHHCDTQVYEKVTKLFGIDVMVAYLFEGVFEYIDSEHCARWVIDSTDAIPVGADLSTALLRWLGWMLSPEAFGCSDICRDPVLRSHVVSVSAIFANDITEQAFSQLGQHINAMFTLPRDLIISSCMRIGDRLSRCRLAGDDTNMRAFELFRKERVNPVCEVMSARMREGGKLHVSGEKIMDATIKILQSSPVPVAPDEAVKKESLCQQIRVAKSHLQFTDV